MYKIIDLGNEFEQTGEPRARLLDTSLVKTASSAIQDYWSTLTPNSEYSYLWVIGVSAMEYYGCNNNGDAFYEADLKKTIPDWEKQANIFVHHVNKDPRKGIGKPVFAWYNEEMHRVELVLAIRKAADGASQIVARIRAGEQMYVSMGCNVKYDVCSICGHESKTRAEYCDHLKFNMKKIIPGGKQVYAINPNPRFFDISIVTRPADPTAFALDKMASYGLQHHTDHPVSFSSAELGEQADDLMSKAASVRKLADILKQVDGHVVDSKIDPAIQRVRDIAEHGFEDFDYPSMPYHALDRIGASPFDLFTSLMGFGLRPTFDDAYWMSGLRDRGVSFREALDNMPRAFSYLGDHPDEIAPSIESAIGGLPFDPLKNNLTAHIVQPIAIQRITIIRRLPPVEIEKTAGQWGKPNITPTDNRYWAQVEAEDEFGNKIVTTPYHLQQAKSTFLPNVGKFLAMAALASLACAKTTTQKLWSATPLAIASAAILGESTTKPKKTYISPNTRLEIPAETLNDAFKYHKTAEEANAIEDPETFGGRIRRYRHNVSDYIHNFDPEKLKHKMSTSMPMAVMIADGIQNTFLPKSKKDSNDMPLIKKTAGLATVVGALTPAAFAADYAINKWRADRNGEYEPDNAAHNFGRTVVEHPLVATGAGLLAGAILHKGIGGLRAARAATRKSAITSGKHSFGDQAKGGLIKKTTTPSGVETIEVKPNRTGGDIPAGGRSAHSRFGGGHNIGNIKGQ